MIKILLLSLVAFHAVMAGTNKIKISKKDCSKILAEFVVVMDASTSIESSNYVIQKKFVADLFKDFSIGRNKTRVGLVTFADNANLVFNLGAHDNYGDLKKAIMGVKYLEGVTAMGAGINLANTAILSMARSGIPKIFIVITDGKNNRWPSATMIAKKVKDEGVRIITVGIGSDISDSELKKVSSSGTYYKVDKFISLPSIREKLHDELCQVLVEIELQTCETMGDLSIVLDGIEADLTKQLELTEHLLQRLEIGPNKQRVALLVDGEGEISGLDKYLKRDDYIKFIRRGKHQFIRKFSNGLIESGRILSASRKNVAKTVVLIRTQEHNELEYLKAAMALRKQGINIITISIGSGPKHSQLNLMSTTKKTINFDNDKFKASYVNEVAGTICENLKLVYRECINREIDLVFVLDCSSSVGPENWLRQLGMVNRVIRMLDVSANRTRVGAVYFNTDASVGYPLNKYTTKTDLIKATLKLPYSEGATAIGDALKLANKDLMSSKRKNAVPVLILITDGRSNFGSDPETVAIKIKNQGVHIISIGITDSISKTQLIRISSLNKFYNIGSFEGIDSFSVEQLTKETCLTIKKKPKKDCDDFEKAGRRKSEL